MEYAEIARGLLPRALVSDVAGSASLNEAERDSRGQLSLSVRLHPAMRRIPLYLASIEGGSLLFKLLNTKHLRCHWPPMARCVLPGCKDALWAPHRDTEYNDHIEGDFVTVWVPLVPIDERCGGLAVLEPERSLVPLELGDAVILSKDCLHFSMPNLSDRPRVSVDYRFFSKGTASSKHYLDLDGDCVVEPAHV